jgi:SagB-type dehydrogenase family enzyme
MGVNSDPGPARGYHELTKHSLQRLQAGRHYLDWDIRPLPFKVYPTLDPVPLPRDLPASQVACLEALHRGPVSRTAPRIPHLTELARILHLSAGITRRKVYPDGQEHFFRAAACTGALYHIDVYAICGDLPDLPAGVYHFGPHDFSLYRLRAGDCRSVVVEATAAEPAVGGAPVILAFASTYWRNSWKYQARAYRHCYWDCGTILANLLAAASAEGVPAHVVCGFVDRTIGALLGLDARREGELALVALGSGGAVPPVRGDIPALQIETLPLSSREVDYPLIREMHAASSLSSPAEVREWRQQTLPAAASPAPGVERIPLRPLASSDFPRESLAAVVLRRGSSRRFARRAISLVQLSTIIEVAMQSLDSDYASSPTELYLIVNAVDDLPAGAYAYRAESRELECLRKGSFRDQAGFLDLGQELAADASVNLYFLCDLEPALTTWGSRGYRVAQLDAAVAGGRAYLAAYALGLGATGLTFFDDDVTDFFSPDAAGKSVLFLAAVGHGMRSLSAAG